MPTRSDEGTMPGEKIYPLTQEQMDMEDDWTIEALKELAEEMKECSGESTGDAGKE